MGQTKRDAGVACAASRASGLSRDPQAQETPALNADSSQPAAEQSAPVSLPQVRPDALRLPGVDGLRGVAVLMVLVTHFCADFWGLGPTRWDNYFQIGTQALGTGVDLFFVISGFLITSILMSTREDPKFFRNFYMRRGLRIFPLYYFSLVAIALCGWLWELKLYPDGALPNLWFLLHSSNVYFILEGWQSPAINPMYSLAMEEHYYLLFPLTVFLLPPKRLLWALLAMLAMSAALRGVINGLDLEQRWFGREDHLLIYCNVLARADGLAFGGLLAWCHERGLLERWRRFYLPYVAALGAVFFAIFVWKKGFWVGSWKGPLGVVGYTLLASWFAAMLAAVVTNAADWFTRLVTMRWLVKVGFYSYSIYLFHELIKIGVEHHVGLPQQLPPLLNSRIPVMVGYTLLMSAATYAFAMVTWWLVEEPCLRLKKHFRYARAG